MQTEAVLIAVIIGFGIIIFLLNKKISGAKTQQADDSLLEWLKSMQQSLENTNKTINEVLRTNSSDMVKTLQENTRQLNERLDKAALVIKDVGKEVGQMSEIGRSMKELQEFLKSPKLRGNLGEQVLKDLISQIFPKNTFHLQYSFKSGDRVDAAIKTDAGILPIDSKFPLENFQRMMKSDLQTEAYSALQKVFIHDVKKHIDSIAKKYIVPDEGTMDFALMYVPSESVYYELINNTELIEYARKKRVYIVSPSTLYIHLQTILLSFEGRKIESKSKEIFKIFRTLQLDYQKVEENMTTLGKHLMNASSQFTNVTTGFNQIGKKLNSTNLLEDTDSKEISREKEKLLY